MYPLAYPLALDRAGHVPGGGGRGVAGQTSQGQTNLLLRGVDQPRGADHGDGRRRHHALQRQGLSVS